MVFFDYSKSKIILIYSNGKYIIGSTTSTSIKQKLISIKYYYRYADNKEFYERANIKVIEYFPCSNKTQLNNRVRFYKLQYKINDLKKQNDNKNLIRLYEDKLAIIKRVNNPINKEINMMLDWNS